MSDSLRLLNAAGLVVAARSFPGEGGRPLHYAFRREPGDEVAKGWRKGREYFVDLADGRWMSWTDSPGRWRPLEALNEIGADDAGSAASPGTQERPDNRTAAAYTAQDGPLCAPVLEDLPADCRPWFSDCVAAGFCLVRDGLNHRGPGFDTGNRFATFAGREELLCGRTRTILDRRCDRWTLAEYLARHNVGPRAGDELITPRRTWLVEHPTAPIAAKQRGLFA